MMGMSLLKEIYTINFDDFQACYNPNNGKTIFIHNAFLDSKTDIFELNDFLGKPNICQDIYDVSICINITSSCNLRCSYCFNDKTHNFNIDYDKAISFIDLVISKIPYANNYYVDLSGSGEPLLFLNKILAIADYCISKSKAIKKKIIPQLVTNGVLLTPKVAKSLQKHLVLFGISIDGYKELHDKNRKDSFATGTYDVIVSNYRKIKNNDYIGVAMTIYDENTDIYRAYMELSFLFKTISIRPARRDYSNFNFSYIITGYERVAEHIINEALVNNSYEFLLKIVNGGDYFGGCIIKICCDAYLTHRCDAGIARFALGSDGYIYPCSSLVFDVQERILMDNKIIIPKCNKCSNCFLFHFCGGMCKIQDSKYNNNENLCIYKKRLFYLAQKVCGTICINNQEIYVKILGEIDAILRRKL